MNVLVSILSGLFGVGVGAYLSWLASKRQRQITVAFDMHREFNSGEMIESRHSASSLLVEFPLRTYTEIREEIGGLRMKDVWLVCAFYQRLWLAISRNGIRKQYVPDLFRDLFYWWYHSSFKTQLAPLATEPAHHIQRLQSWMMSNSSEAQRQRWH
jgi:hypothetical protein